MSARIDLIGEDTIALTFPYDAMMVAAVKQLRRRRWNAAAKRWEVHLAHLPEVVRILGVKPELIGGGVIEGYRQRWAGRPLTVRLDTLRGRLTGTEGPLDAIDRVTSFAVPGHKFAPTYKSGKWDGRKHLFDTRTQSFPAGLWEKVRGELDRQGVKYELEVAAEPEAGAATLETGPERRALRPYQADALEKAVAAGRGIVQVATGGGKTLLAAHLIRRIGRPAFFFVHTLDLLYQSAEALAAELGIEVGILGDGQANLRPVTVATIQTAARACEGTKPARGPRRAAFDEPAEEKRREERPLEVDEATCREVREALEGAPVVIFDECHHVPADTFYRIAMRTKGARWRYGLSATPWRDDACDLLLEAALGPTLVKVRASDLIDQGYLVAPRIRMLRTPAVHMSRRGLDWHTCYQTAIVENRERNRAISAAARALAEEGRSVLVLVTQVAHGERLLEALPEAVFIHGGVESGARREALRDLEQKLRPMMIATTLADEGLDVPTLGALVLGGGGKSATRAFQRIGRVLRPAPGKTEAIVVDFRDEAPWLREHSVARLALYRQAPRFVGEGE